MRISYAVMKPVCLGYSLYHQLTANNVKCEILAPTTMLEQRSKKRIKTDNRIEELASKDEYKESAQKLRNAMAEAK